MSVSQEAFDRAVREIAETMGAEGLLAIPGVWELVAEEVNNDALDRAQMELECDE